MKTLVLLGALLASVLCMAQGYSSDTMPVKEDKHPAFFYLGTANYDVDRHSAEMGISAAISVYNVYVEANTNSIFRSHNRTDVWSTNYGYTFNFLDNKLGFTPFVGMTHFDFGRDTENKFNSGFILQAQIYKPLYCYAGIGQHDGVKCGLALKL